LRGRVESGSRNIGDIGPVECGEMGGEVAGEVGDLSNKLDLLSNMTDVLSNRPTGFGGREKEVRGYLYPGDEGPPAITFSY